MLQSNRQWIALLSILFACELNARTLIFQSQPEPTPEQAQYYPASTESASESPAPSAAQYSTSGLKAQSASASVTTELLLMIEQLQQEVRALRGLVEEQSYQLRSLQESSKARYKDLDSRVMALSQSASVPVAAVNNAKAATSETAVSPAGSPVRSGGASATPTEAQRLEYQAAYNFIKERKFNEAIDAMHAFIEKYPEGELTGNAYYWLGEVYLVLPKLEQAKQAFSIVVKSFPDHRKLPDALFKLAVTHDRMQDPATSEKFLDEVQQKYPGSTAAKLAAEYKIAR